MAKQLVSTKGPILVRTSERASFLKCRQSWYWGWVERLKHPDTDPKLVFGDLVHQALAIYYKKGTKRGPLPAETFEQLCTTNLDEFQGRIWSEDEFVDVIELGVTMLERYVDHWSEADKEFRIISSEQVFEVPIGRYNGRKVFYVGTIDGVWQSLSTGKIRFAEHKTATAISEDALPMDEQVGAYWTYGPRWLRLKGILKSGEELDGILYNWLRKAAPKPEDLLDSFGRKLNKDGSISKRQPPKFFHRKNTFRGQAEAEAVKARVWKQVRDMEDARNDPEMIYKNPGPQFMPNCKFCSFRDMCELHETGNDYQAYKTIYVTYDPYSAHDRAERQ
jgi:hypothetical protein